MFNILLVVTVLNKYHFGASHDTLPRCPQTHTLLLSHLGEAPGGQGVREGMAPGILLQQVRDEPHRSGVHLLQPDADNTAGGHQHSPLNPPGFAWRRVDKTSPFQRRPGFFKVLLAARLPFVPDHVEVRGRLDVQLQQGGDVLRRFCRGHVPGHNLQPDREGKQTHSVICRISSCFSRRSLIVVACGGLNAASVCWLQSEGEAAFGTACVNLKLSVGAKRPQS